MGVPVVNVAPGFVVTTPPTVVVQGPPPTMMTTTVSPIPPYATYQQQAPPVAVQQTMYQAPQQQQTSVFNTNYQAPPPAQQQNNMYQTQVPPSQGYNQQPSYNQGSSYQSNFQQTNFNQGSYGSGGYNQAPANNYNQGGSGNYGGSGSGGYPANQGQNQGYSQNQSSYSSGGYNQSSGGYNQGGNQGGYNQGNQGNQGGYNQQGSGWQGQNQNPPPAQNNSPFSTTSANYDQRGPPTRVVSQSPASWGARGQDRQEHQEQAPARYDPPAPAPQSSSTPQYTTSTTYERDFVVPEQAPPQQFTPPPAAPPANQPHHAPFVDPFTDSSKNAQQPAAPKVAATAPGPAKVAPAANTPKVAPGQAAPVKLPVPASGGNPKKFVTPGNMKGPTVSSASASGGQHTYSKEEVRSFTDFINQLLKDDPDLKRVLPMATDSEQLFSVCSQSILLPKLINAVKPGTIDERKICVKPDMSTFEMIQNHDLAIKGAKDLGCNIINIGGLDLMEEKPYLLLGIVWQIVEKGLMSKVSLDAHPELISMMEANEDLAAFANKNPAENLLRWFNFHLTRAGHPRRVSNFDRDIKDGENYLVLLSQIAPHQVPRDASAEQDPARRADMVCGYAAALDALRFVTPADILAGNAKLNLAFTAYLFNKYPGLDATQDAQRLEEAERVMREKYAREDAERRARWEAEEAERQRRWAEEEAARKRRMEEEEAARRQRWAEEEKAMRERLNEEERRKREEMLRAEAELRARQEAAEAEARAKEEERRRQEILAEQARIAEEERRRRWEAEQAMQQRMLAEEDARRRAEEARRQEEMRRLAWEEEQRRQEAERQRQAAEQEKARLRAWDEYNAKQAAMQEEMRKQAWAQYHQQQTIIQQQQAQAALLAQQQTTVTTTFIPPPVVQQQTTVVTTSVFPIPRLHVTVCRARRLIPTGVVLLPDPYVWVCRGSERYKTHHIASSQDPVWNSPFEFRFVNEFDEIVIDVYDRNLVGKDRFMGQVKLTKNDFALIGERWYPLRSRTYKADAVHGEILIDIGASA